MQTKVENIKSAKLLVIKYRSFSIVKIKELYSSYLLSKKNDWMQYSAIMEKFSGFGRLNTCSLCVEINRKFGTTLCSKCIYHDQIGEYYRCQTETYVDIMCARTDEELVKTVHARADYIEGLIKEYELHGNKE